MGAGDHPRSRGVYWRLEVEVLAGRGSSPLARGLRDVPGHPLNLRRIIPARAGFTRSSTSGRSRSRDHPRSRGVYGRASPARRGLVGSSPLARGLPSHVRRRVAGPGIIPARAGFTSGGGTLGPSPQDHPRSRGVYRSRRAGTTLPPGSSPLARGLLDRHPLARVQSGIIPARAGFTRSMLGVPSCWWDHPRSRGVYEEQRNQAMATIGSSPLARGLQILAHLLAAAIGIIPARAGFTSCGRSWAGPGRDHPRSRGVYGCVSAVTSVETGSSPLARGLHRLHNSAPLGGGIIPARAGFTWSCAWAPQAFWDHPRSRGVY